MLGDVLGLVAISDEAALLAPLNVLRLVVLGEAPLFGDDDLLATGELELGTAKRLNSDAEIVIPAPDRKENLSNLDPSNAASGLAVCVPHTSLEPIGTSARKHLVDAEDVEGVRPDAEVEAFLASASHKVLVARNTGSLECLGGDLLTLVRKHVNDGGEHVDTSGLVTDIEDANLRLGDTTKVPRLDVRLVLAVPVAASGTATHFG